MRAFNFVNWLFPDNSKFDKEKYTKVKVTVYGLVIVIITSIVLLAVNQILGVHTDFPFSMLIGLCLILLIVFKYTGSLLIIGNLLGCSMALSMLPLSLNTGGIFSEDLHGIFLIPLTVFALAGFKSALAWVIFSIGWAIYIYLQSVSPEQLNMFRQQTDSLSPEYYLIIVLVSLIFPFMVYYLLYYQNLKLIGKFKTSEQDLEQKNKVFAEQAEQLKDTQIKLERSNTELKQFAHVTSHDLKQPIRTINGFANLLNQHLEGNDKLDETSNEYVQLIIQASNNMNTLVSDLLSYAKLKSLDELPFKEQSLNDVIQDVTLSLKNQIDSADVTIVKSDLPRLRVVPVKINQLFQNLISNAIKFKKSTEKLKIEIKAEDKGSIYLFSIRDNGIGIEKKHLEKIFNPFVKLHSEADYSGSGIGLATCKKIVELHNGKIWIDSVLGQGSTFCFTLKK